MDEQAWIQGRYSYIGFATVLSNAFKKKGAPPSTYPEQPFLMEKKPDEMSEEEKTKHIDKIFHTLEIMKYNFDMNKKAKGGA